MNPAMKIEMKTFCGICFIHSFDLDSYLHNYSSLQLRSCSQKKYLLPVGTIVEEVSLISGKNSCATAVHFLRNRNVGVHSNIQN